MTDMLPVLQVAGLELGKNGITAKLGISRNDHMVEVIVGYEDLRVAEVIAGVSKVRAVERPQLIFCPGFEICRCGTHHDLAVLAVAIVTSIIYIICTVLLVSTASTNGSILLIVVAAKR